MKNLQDPQKLKEAEEYFTQFHQVEMNYMKYWAENTLWQWDFWLSMFLSIAPWIAWFIFRRRGSEARLLLVGLYTIIVSSFLDFVGIVLGLWHYSGKALPWIPTYFPWDFCLIPVTIMLWIQCKPYWNPLMKAVIYSGISSFIGEPLFEWLGLYSSEHWRPIYSFPIYIIIYLVAYRISKSSTFDELK